VRRAPQPEAQAAAAPGPGLGLLKVIQVAVTGGILFSFFTVFFFQVTTVIMMRAESY
jgi:hypothetical protein